MALKTIRLGPWPLGEDRVHGREPTHAVYQLSDERAARLLRAVNVDLDDSGWPRRRAGLVARVALTDGKGLFSGAGLLLVQDGGTIKLVDPSTWGTIDLVTGLGGAPVQFHELAGQVFWSDGVAHGIVTAAGQAVNWGMAVPSSPTLGVVPGGLPAGRYRVACLSVDAQGVYSGAPAAAAVSVDGSQAIQVSVVPNDASATHVRVYASFANAPDLYFVGQVAVGALPVTILDVQVSNEVLHTQFLSGPQSLPGIEGISSWRGFLLLWRGSRVVHSMGNAHHLFDLRSAVWKLPYAVRAVAGIDGPCWVATARGMFRYTGVPGSPDFARVQVDRRAYAAGFAVVAASKLGFLEGVSGRVALFASEDGLAVGLPDGGMVYPMEGRVRWDVDGKRATIIYRESDDINQVLVSLE